jgi:hypothetical protein
MLLVMRFRVFIIHVRLGYVTRVLLKQVDYKWISSFFVCSELR